MDALLDAAAVAIARAIRSRDASSHEVTLDFLERIRERSPAINAAVQIADERALAEAARVDAALAWGGAWALLGRAIHSQGRIRH